MTTQFKCLVELNDNNYRVFVDNQFNRNESKIKFKEVLAKIRQIDQKIDFSFDSFLFEVLDKDFGEYVVICDENEFCDNLSIIRITNRGNKSDNKFNKSNNCDKSSKPKSSPKKTNDYSCRPSTSSSTNTDQTFGSNDQNSTNALIERSLDELDRKLMASIDIPVLSTDDIQEIKELLQLLDTNRCFFGKNPENSGNWLRISHQMRSKGYQSNGLKHLFLRYETIYEKVLEYASDVRTATEYFPLFESFETMNLCPFIPELTNRRIELLRQRFSLRQLMSQSRANCSSDQYLTQSSNQTPNQTFNPFLNQNFLTSTPLATAQEKRKPTTHTCAHSEPQSKKIKAEIPDIMDEFRNN